VKCKKRKEMGGGNNQRKMEEKGRGHDYKTLGGCIR